MSFLKFLKHALKAVIPPKAFIKFLIWKRGYPEPELRLIKILSDKNKISIDVGASEGLYTAHLFLNSRKCIAFEPRKEASVELSKITAGLDPPVQIETVALSDFTGEAQLKIFAGDAGRSTFEEANLIENEGQIEIVPIVVKKLDDYDFECEIGFMKIDVEGYEMKVLMGALKVIGTARPRIIVETHTIELENEVRAFLKNLNYAEPKEYGRKTNKDGTEHVNLFFMPNVE